MVGIVLCFLKHRVKVFQGNQHAQKHIVQYIHWQLKNGLLKVTGNCQHKTPGGNSGIQRFDKWIPTSDKIVQTGSEDNVVKQRV